MGQQWRWLDGIYVGQTCLAWCYDFWLGQSTKSMRRVETQMFRMEFT